MYNWSKGSSLKIQAGRFWETNQSKRNHLPQIQEFDNFIARDNKFG